MKKIICVLILFSQLLVAAWAQTFVVRNIEFQGLQYISKSTVESYLPIKRGQVLKAGQSAEVIRALYKTGFFERVNLSKVGNTLVIRVVERPTIGQLKISGNTIIPTDKLTSVMRSVDVAEGRVYNPAILGKITQSLLAQYYTLGRYNAQVNVKTTPMSRNRVAVNIDISEGLIAKIQRISIIGNHAFSERTLLRQLDMSTSNILSFITQSDRYAEARLEQDLEKLRAYYLDHGYLRVEVTSSQAQVTPDHKSVYITIIIKENDPFIVSETDVTGDLPFPREEFTKRLVIKPGEIFSRQKIIDSEKVINAYLGNNGYLFSNIALQPRVNDKDHTVVLVFNVIPGKRAYVRHVNFSDNNHTNDRALRREVTQLEAAPASTTKLEDSKHRLTLLPFIKDVEMNLSRVTGKEDQIDVNYKVKEDNSAQASFKVGYSQDYKFLIGAGVNQKNFLGTGNNLGINFNTSKYEQFYSVDYTDPYYTEDGISRSISASISRTNPAAIARLNNSYLSSEYDFGLLYGIPVGQDNGVFSRVLAGISYQNTLITLNSNPLAVSNQVLTFINNHGRRFQELDFKLGYSRDSRDRAIFPTRGSVHAAFVDVFAPLSRGSLAFYMLNYHMKWYQPLCYQFIFLTRADLGYGNGFNGINSFPFFKNYYAGGIDSVRGFQGYTLGPLDSRGQAYGANMLADASVSLIFPNFITDSLRTSVFVDAGNVYGSNNNRSFGGFSTNSGPIRYSVGIEADWLTPFGPIQLSLAKPFLRKGDQKDVFQFALGANF